MLYTLNLYSAVCQLYLNKTEKKKRMHWEFPGSPVGLRAFTAKGLGSNPGWGIKIPQAMWRGQKQKQKECIEKCSHLFFYFLKEFKLDWFNFSLNV